MAVICIYAAIELATVLTIILSVWHQLHFSLFKQLAFVLDKQWRFVQTKLVLWVIYVIQCSQVHFGE